LASDHYLHTRLVDAKLFIDEHYAEDLPVGLMAERACFSRYHFIRLFTRSYGLTPHQYLTRLRIRKAKELIHDGATVTAALFGTGFTSMSSFNKLFKRHVRVAPSVYLRQVSDRRQRIVDSPLEFIPDCFIDYMGWGK
jgi:AraC-like DNA-binding protein